MNCPSCKVGTIRMLPGMHCGCGHPYMVCDGCRHAFQVKHDEKNRNLLPPEAEIEDRGPFWNERVMDFRKELIMQGASITPEPIPTDLPTVEEMHTLIQIFDGIPIADIYDMLPDVYHSFGDKIAEGETLDPHEQLIYDTAERWWKASMSV